MENNSSKTPTANWNRTAPSKSLPSSSFSWFEKDGDDWDARQFLNILQRRALVIAGVATLVMGFATYSTMKQKPVYEANFQLLVEPVNEESRLKGLTQDAGLSKPSLDYESQIQVLKSPELMAGIIKQLQNSYPDINYNSLINSLTIARLGQTKVIQVSYKSDNPEKIKVVLDTMSNYYLNYSLEKRQTKLRQGIQFVEKQLPPVRNQVSRLQKELQFFRQRYRFINPETQATQIATQITNLVTQKQTVEQQLATARANLAILQGKEAEQTILINSPLYQEVMGQLRQLESQIALESARFQEDSPTIVTLKEKRQKLYPLLQQEAQRVLGAKFAEAAIPVQILEVQSQELAKLEQRLYQEFNELPALFKKYNELQEELQIAKESLTRFLVTRQTLQIENAQTELPWELIQAALRPEAPISPNIQRNLMVGLAASLTLGIAAGLLADKADNTYHTAESIKQKIKLPLLAILPIDKTLQNSQYAGFKETEPSQPSLKLPKLPKALRGKSSRERYYGQGRFWEALQVLNTNIQLLSSDKPIRSIVISSALPGDGKSTVAFNLAQIAATMGKKVLLVDADLRRPQIHKRAELNNLWGLTSLISTDVPPSEVIQQMPSMKNLSVITSGPTPPDPARLLSSDKMKRLMAEFHENFDFIIYDMPPIVGLVDVRLLAPSTDGIVLVARIDKTDKLGLSQAQDSLKISPINVLGIVINGDKTKFKGYNYYYSARKS